MVERSPSQTLRLGEDNGAITEHQLPFFKASGDLCPTTTTSGRTEEQSVTLERENTGVAGQEVTAVTQDLSKPVRVNFRASSLMSSPREVSHRVQRRE